MIDGYVSWEVRINHKKGNLPNAIITDELTSEDGDMTGIHYITDSFKLYEIVADEFGNITSYRIATDISNDIVFSDNNTKFSYRMGDITGKQYLLVYKTTYKPSIKLRNKVTLGSEQLSWVSSSSAVFSELGGQGSGNLTSKIKIIKVDAEKQEIRLAGAKFLVTKLADNSTFTLTTNAEGEAVSDKLIPGKYKIKEIEKPVGYVLNEEEYEVIVTETEACIKTITNEPEKIDIKVQKKWIGPVGASVIAQVKAEGSNDVVAEYELKESEGWKYTFTGLDKYAADGTLIKYKVVEKNVPQGYTATYEQVSEGNWIIKNLQDKIKVKVTKEWEGVTGNHPTIKLQLLKNGQNEGSPIELTNGTTTHTWTDLDKTDAQGNEYNYTVKEVGETANSIQLDGDWYKVSYGGNTQDGLTVTNKKLSPWTPMIPPTRDIKVTKDWKDSSENRLDAPVDKIKVELYKDGTATGDIKELKKDNNWTVTFEKLKVYESIENPAIHKYTVKEVGEIGSAIQFDGKWFQVTYDGTMAEGFTITNKEKTPWTPMEPPVREIKVTKLWKDHNGKPITAPTDKIIAELYKDGNPTGKKEELNAGNNWTVSFKNLEVANGLGSTDYYKYTVKEIGEDGNAVKFDGKQYKVVYGGSMKDGLTITNEKEAPPTPPTPNNPTPNKPEVPNTSTNKTLPKTGDGSNISLYAWLMLTSGALLVLIGYKRRKHAK